MQRSDIIEKLKDVLQMAMGSALQLPENYGEQSRLVEDLGLNSVGILYVVIAIEEYFNVQFEEIGFGDFKTVGDVVTYIEKKVS